MLWIVGLIFTLTKGKVVHFIGTELYVPDLLTLEIAYIFLRYGHVGAIVFALGQGFFVDLFSGGMHGLFTFLYMVVFVGVWVGSRFFNIQSPKGQLVIVCLAMLIKKVFLLIMLHAFSQMTYFLMFFVWISVGLVLWTGLLAPLFFYFFNLLRALVLEEAPATSKDQFWTRGEP